MKYPKSGFFIIIGWGESAKQFCMKLYIRCKQFQL